MKNNPTPTRKSHIEWHRMLVAKVKAADTGEGPGLTLDESALLCLHQIQNRMWEITEFIKTLTVTQHTAPENEESHELPAAVPVSSSGSSDHRGDRADSNGKRQHPGAVPKSAGVAEHRSNRVGAVVQLPTRRTRKS